MKTILITAAAVLSLTSSAFAAEQKLISLQDLRSEVKNIQLMIGEDQHCALSVHKIENGIRVSMSSEKEGIASIDAIATDAVLLDTEYAADGSVKKEFVVPGRGTLTAIVADDSYFQATLEIPGQKISCELDF